MQVEVLRRLRHGGQQFVRVKHVHRRASKSRSSRMPPPYASGEGRLAEARFGVKSLD
jgi:hypothetical protein